MDEIERSRLQLAGEQVVEDQFHVRDPFLLKERPSSVEQALVDGVPHHLAERADPFAEESTPAQGSAPDVQSASAGPAAELREKLPPTWLPHQRLQPQPLELRGLSRQQVPIV